MKIKVLSLWNPPEIPFASLIIIGAKRYETRPRRLAHRGPLLIHATKNCDSLPADWATRKMVAGAWSELADDHPAFEWDANAPQGVILGGVNMTDCQSVGLFNDNLKSFRAEERAFGNFAPGRWIYTLENPIALRAPVPASGRQGMWEYDPSDQPELLTLIARLEKQGGYAIAKEPSR